MQSPLDVWGKECSADCSALAYFIQTVSLDASSAALTAVSRGPHTLYCNVKGKAIPVQAQKVPGGWGCQHFETIGSWRWWGQPYAPAALTPRKYSWYSSERLSQPQGHNAARRFMSMKNSSDIIGNRTRDLPASTSCALILLQSRSSIYLLYLKPVAGPSSRAV